MDRWTDGPADCSAACCSFHDGDKMDKAYLQDIAIFLSISRLFRHIPRALSVGFRRWREPRAIWSFPGFPLTHLVVYLGIFWIKAF